MCDRDETETYVVSDICEAGVYCLCGRALTLTARGPGDL